MYIDLDELQRPHSDVTGMSGKGNHPQKGRWEELSYTIQPLPDAILEREKP